MSYESLEIATQKQLLKSENPYLKKELFEKQLWFFSPPAEKKPEFTVLVEEIADSFLKNISLNTNIIEEGYALKADYHISEGGIIFTNLIVYNDNSQYTLAGELNLNLRYFDNGIQLTQIVINSEQLRQLVMGSRINYKNEANFVPKKNKTHAIISNNEPEDEANVSVEQIDKEFKEEITKLLQSQKLLEEGLRERYSIKIKQGSPIYLSAAESVGLFDELGNINPVVANRYEIVLDEKRFSVDSLMAGYDLQKSLLEELSSKQRLIFDGLLFTAIANVQLKHNARITKLHCLAAELMGNGKPGEAKTYLLECQKLNPKPAVLFNHMPLPILLNLLSPKPAELTLLCLEKKYRDALLPIQYIFSLKYALEKDSEDFFKKTLDALIDIFCRDFEDPMAQIYGTLLNVINRNATFFMENFVLPKPSDTILDSDSTIKLDEVLETLETQSPPIIEIKEDIPFSDPASIEATTTTTTLSNPAPIEITITTTKEETPVSIPALIETTTTTTAVGTEIDLKGKEKVGKEDNRHELRRLQAEQNNKLYLAVKANNLALVKKALREGANPNTVPKHKAEFKKIKQKPVPTLLHMLLYYKSDKNEDYDLEIARELIQAGAKTKVRDFKGRMPDTNPIIKKFKQTFDASTPSKANTPIFKGRDNQLSSELTKKIENLAYYSVELSKKLQRGRLNSNHKNEENLLLKIYTIQNLINRIIGPKAMRIDADLNISLKLPASPKEWENASIGMIKTLLNQFNSEDLNKGRGWFTQIFNLDTTTYKKFKALEERTKEDLNKKPINYLQKYAVHSDLMQAIQDLADYTVKLSKDLKYNNPGETLSEEDQLIQDKIYAIKYLLDDMAGDEIITILEGENLKNNVISNDIYKNFKDLDSHSIECMKAKLLQFKNSETQFFKTINTTRGFFSETFGIKTSTYNKFKAIEEALHCRLGQDPK